MIWGAKRDKIKTSGLQQGLLDGREAGQVTRPLSLQVRVHQGGLGGQARVSIRTAPGAVRMDNSHSIKASSQPNPHPYCTIKADSVYWCGFGADAEKNIQAA